MKKIGILVAFIIVITIIGFILPTHKEYTTRVIVNCAPTAATRVMSDPLLWKTWWPGEIINDTSFTYHNKSIQIKNILLNGFYAVNTDLKIPSTIDLQFLSAPNKQSEFIYTYTLYYSSNPFIKWIQFFQSNTIKSELISFLNDIKNNLEDVKKVYGFEIIEERVPNAIHISMKKEFSYKPGNKEIYSIVDELNKYITTKNAKAINAPIYNIFTADDEHYQLMVAIATDKPLPTTDRFLFKEMVRGKIIIGKAIGSDSSVDQCSRQVEYFVKDHGRSSPAIQFNRLVTDRRIEKDSLNWITTINYPVFDRSFF